MTKRFSFRHVPNGTVGIAGTLVVKKIQSLRPGNVRVVLIKGDPADRFLKVGKVFDIDADACWTVDDSELAAYLGYPDLSVDAALTAIALC